MDEIKKLIREVLLEKKKKRDRCLRIADRKYDTPSAYKSGAVVRCRQGEIWKGIKEETTYHEINESQKYNQDSIEQIFKNTPQLSNIGTIEQYTKYLETIFPNSKLKGIVYHGGTLNSKDRGKDSFTGEYGGKHGMYFTGSPGRAKNYIKGGNDDYKSRSKVYFALLNIERPLDKKIWSKWKYNADTITDEGFKQMKDNNADGIIVTDLLSKINITQYGTQYVVLDMDQVHILGSKQDIEGFQKYVKIINEAKKENKYEGLEDTSWTNADNKKLTLKQLLDVIKNYPTTQVPIEKLKKIVIKKDSGGIETPRLDKADVKYPIIIVIDDNNNFRYILDGNHRVQKAMAAGLKSIPAKLLNIKDLPEKFQGILSEAKKETLRTWFKRKGAPGKTGGWIDCNAPIRKDGKIVGYKPCGRKKGEKRAYPACKETPAQCKAPGKGKTWGKKSG
jgi:hypothetical protein